MTTAVIKIIAPKASKGPPSLEKLNKPIMNNIQPKTPVIAEITINAL